MARRGDDKGGRGPARRREDGAPAGRGGTAHRVALTLCLAAILLAVTVVAVLLVRSLVAVNSGDLAISPPQPGDAPSITVNPSPAALDGGAWSHLVDRQDDSAARPLAVAPRHDPAPGDEKASREPGRSSARYDGRPLSA